MRTAEYFLSFFIGAIGYWAIELMYRGYTHWTMPLTGGICYIIIYLIANFTDESLVKKWIMSASCILTIEFVVGAIINITLGWAVWDYSSLPYNLFGQISLLFFCYWFILSIPAVFLSNIIRYYVFIPLYKEGKHSL